MNGSDYGRIGEGAAFWFIVLLWVSGFGVLAMVALVVVAVNTWDCSVKVEREADQSGESGSDEK